MSGVSQENNQKFLRVRPSQARHDDRKREWKKERKKERKNDETDHQSNLILNKCIIWIERRKAPHINVYWWYRDIHT